MVPQAGLLADRYELTSLIAGGGMGQVWRARDTLLDRPVAVKLLREQFAEDPVFRARFRAEAQHAALLAHPNIAAVFDYGETPAGPRSPAVAYLVMELVEGESLADILRREGRLPAELTLSVLRQTASGLAAAHAAGVVHRDIKPANLLVAVDGTVKLTDFGISRSATSAAVTGTGQVIGTAHYLSPEQAAGQSATPASDVYALGAVGYECLAGRRAFDGESPVQVAVKHIREHPPLLPADVPPAVRDLVERAMVKDPSARYRDGAALRDAIDAVLAGAPLAPAPQPPTAVLPAVPADPRPPSPWRRRRLALPVLLGALAVLAAVLVPSFLGDRAAPEADAGPTTATTTPAGIDVVAADWVGRPVREVRSELIGRGLDVRLAAVETAEVPAGQVTAVDPTGTLAPGDVVTVTYAVPPVVVPAPAEAPPVVDGGNGSTGTGDTGNEGNGNAEKGKGKEKENPGRGNGNGRGN